MQRALEGAHGIVEIVEGNTIPRPTLPIHGTIYSIVIDGDVSNLHIIAFQWKSIGLLAQPLAEGVVGHPIGINEIQNEDADKNADSI